MKVYLFLNFLGFYIYIYIHTHNSWWAAPHFLPWLRKSLRFKRLWFDQGFKAWQDQGSLAPKTRTYYVAETGLDLGPVWYLPLGNSASEWKLRGPDAMSRP